MTCMASSSCLSDVGLRPRTRTTESPRPIPQIVRLPNVSLRVAKVEAVTEGSRLTGLVTKGSDHDPLRRGEHLRVYDVGLLPEDVGVEGPGVSEAEFLGPPSQLDDPACRWIRLKRDAEVHAFLLILARDRGHGAECYQDAA